MKTSTKLLIGVILSLIVFIIIDNIKDESEKKDLRQDYVILREKQIERNDKLIDSIEFLNRELEKKISDSKVITETTNVRREQNKKNYENAVKNADTITDISFLQRKLSDIFER